MEPKIIYEDGSLFVVDKPAGWITNEADTTTDQPVVQKWLRESFDYPLKGSEEYRDGVVHRLDKETTYIALIHGKVDPEEGEVSVPMGRLPWRRDRFGVLPGGRQSQSAYKVIKFFPEERGGYSLVEFYPKTGRTHQIRIHAKHMGHAIVADEFYAGRKTARNDRKFCPRLFLHASGIKFIHPKSLKEMEFVSPLPEDLKKVVEEFESKKIS